LLKKYNPSIDKALLRLAELARDDNSFIEQQALQSWSGVAREEDGAIYLDKRKICLLPLALQRQLIRIAVDKVLGDTRDIEASHIEAIRSLLNKPVGKRISLPHSLVCWGEYDEVVMTRGFPLSSLCPFPPLPGEFSLNIPGKTVLPGWRAIATIIPVIASRDSERNEACSPFVIASRSCEPKAWSEAKQSYERFIAQFDLHQAGTELFVRQRQAGDRFQPLGMDMPKKLQHFMVDAKIPLSWRENIPLVCSPKQIIWVVGWRIDDRVKVTEATKEILRLEFRKAS
jgi:tRNA(Ile)-lysidine synthase